MSRFLKLTNFILNANDIHKIVINPNVYYIHIASKQISGFSWTTAIFGFGSISSYSDLIEVCEKKHATDYKTVSEWINKIE